MAYSIFAYLSLAAVITAPVAISFMLKKAKNSESTIIECGILILCGFCFWGWLLAMH